MNIQNLKDDVDFLCGSTSATYSNVNKVRNMNIAYHDIARLVWESDGGWSYDDSNNTDAPIAYKTLGNASASYTIPTTALRIEGIEVKDNGGDWKKILPITYHELSQAPQEFLSGGGFPIYYQLKGNEINLFPSPTTSYVTLASGMLVRLSRVPTELVATATTTTPGFATPFHRILSLAAAIDFIQDSNQRQFLAIQKDRLEKGLIKFYSKRADEFKSSLTSTGKKTWRQYL